MLYDVAMVIDRLRAKDILVRDMGVSESTAEDFVDALADPSVEETIERLDARIQEQFHLLRTELVARIEIVERNQESDRRTNEERFDLIDRRFEEVDRRFEDVDRRFDDVDRRLDLIDRRLEGAAQDRQKIRDEFRQAMADQTIRLERMMYRVAVAILGGGAAIGSLIALILELT